jgi:DNA-directed RNA polymerase subunit RPC12/RpoP
MVLGCFEYVTMRRKEPKIRCKKCGREFTPDTDDDVDLVEWLFEVEGVECPHCGSYCPLGEGDRDDP